MLGPLIQFERQILAVFSKRMDFIGLSESERRETVSRRPVGRPRQLASSKPLRLLEELLTKASDDVQRHSAVPNRRVNIAEPLSDEGRFASL